jgi:hypothetical protein
LENNSPFSLIGMLLSGAIALFLAFSAFAVLSDVTRNVDRSLVANIDDPSQAFDALKARSKSELEELTTRETAALVANPLDDSALANLVLLHDLTGNKKLSERYAKLAADRSLHNTKLQVLGMEAALKREDYADALYRLDGLIRINLDKRKTYFEVLRNLVEIPKAINNAGALIGKNPPWRSNFLYELTQTSRRPETVYELLAALKSSENPPTDVEMSWFFSKLVTEKKFDFANYVWLDFLTDAELAKAGLIFDGGFDLPIRNNIFGWTYYPTKNAELKFVPKGTSTPDKVVQVSFSGGRTPFYNFVQYLRLQPGVYQFSGEAKADDLKTSGGLVWRIYCVETSSLLMQAGKISTSSPWTPFSQDFTVPAEECATQFIRLDTASYAELDSEIFGRIAYDNLKINPRQKQ